MKNIAVTVCCLKDDDKCEQHPIPKTSNKAKITVVNAG